MFRATKVASYLKTLEQLGFGKSQLFARTKIDTSRIHSPDYLITEEQYYAVVSNMIRLTGNPGIAFSLGKSADLIEYGIVGYAMISANTLADATDVWIKYSNSLIGSPMRTDWYAVSHGHELTFTSPAPLGALHRFETEEMLVQGINIIRDLCGTEPVFERVSFVYPEPSHVALYYGTFQCPLEFDATNTVARILKPEFDAPVKTKNEELYSICAMHCSEVLSSLSAAGLLRDQLRTIFLKTPGRLPTLEDAGAALGMSANTLLRRLDSTGHTYQEIKDEFRFDLARKYLHSGRIHPKQVAYLLGFTSPSNFSRAFKSWSGQTVRQFLMSGSE
jgi:AraC-like DNA-binding protein